MNAHITSLQINSQPQIKGQVLHEFHDREGNAAYVVQQQDNVSIPLLSIECLLLKGGVYEHQFITHTTNPDPKYLKHYLNMPNAKNSRILVNQAVVMDSVWRTQTHNFQANERDTK